MSTSQLYHTQGIKEFHHVSHSYIGKHLIWTIKRNYEKFKCNACMSSRVKATEIGSRKVKGLPMGKLKTSFRVIVHRLKCRDCGAYRMEKLDFLPSQKSHFTKGVARCAVELRNEMTIKAVSEHLDLHWNTVKEIEKRYLRKKYAFINLSQVTVIGIDEVHIGGKKFLTVVRDLTTGAVLFIGDGKSGDSLAPFADRLKRSACRIRTVAVDLAHSFTAWVRETLPEATIVYDRFHVVKLMNDKLNAVRRKTMNKLEEDEKKILKGKRFTLLKNEENLTESAEKDLREIRRTYNDLGEMSLMKECLRNIYAIAEWEEEARIGFVRWCALAEETGIAELKTMAKTVRTKFEGIVAYWKNKITSASMEGFNNKIGWLNRQAYGYRDLEYFKLKIFGLPKMQIIRSL